MFLRLNLLTICLNPFNLFVCLYQYQKYKSCIFYILRFYNASLNYLIRLTATPLPHTFYVENARVPHRTSMA